MAKFPITKVPFPIISASPVKQAYLLANLSLTETVTISPDRSVSPGTLNGDDIPPLGTASLNTQKQYYAVAPAMASLQVMREFSNWSASPAQIAEQIALAGINVNINGFTVYTPSGDTTGGSDVVNVQNLLSLFGTVYLGPGLYYGNAPVLLNQNGQQLWGSPGAIWIPTAPMAAAFETSAINLRVSGFQIYGGTNITSGNPACGCFQINPGTLRCIIEGVYPLYMNGAFLSGVPAGPLHLTIRTIKGTNNNSGISLVAAGTVPAQVVMEDIDLQACQTGPALALGNVTDIAVAKFNAAVAAGVNNCMTITDGCQTMFFDHMDLSGGLLSVLGVSDAGTGSSEVDFESSVFQNSSSGNGVSIANNAARFGFSKCMSKRNWSDGWNWSGTGAFNTMTDCGGNLNNQSGATGYDVNATSTAKLKNHGFRYVSGAVTAGRNLTVAGNHYTEDVPPSSLTTAGFAPGGW